MSDPHAAKAEAGSSAQKVLEDLIARCWGEVLRLEEPDREDDFFELGGDSIKGLELADKIAEALPFEAPLVALFFQDPTIRGLAAAIAAEVGAEELARITAK
jgi:acyl carrier protein